MTADHALVLLHSASTDPGGWSAVRRGLPADLTVLTPQLPGLEAADPEPFSLIRAADAVRRAVDDAGLSSAAVCGVGLGALVALQLAADQPDRVSRLVLLTRQTRHSPILMSLPAAVLRLIPATVAQRLGIATAQVVALLDEVRPVDFTTLARTVRVPTVVLCGARDTLNRHTSAVLARTVAHGELRLVHRAPAGWVEQSPELLAEALVGMIQQA